AEGDFGAVWGAGFDGVGTGTDSVVYLAPSHSRADKALITPALFSQPPPLPPGEEGVVCLKAGENRNAKSFGGSRGYGWFRGRIPRSGRSRGWRRGASESRGPEGWHRG